MDFKETPFGTEIVGLTKAINDVGTIADLARQLSEAREEKERFKTLYIETTNDHLTEIARLRKDYTELIMAVSNKFPFETRHQTALRYIQERESYVSEGKAQCHKSLEASDGT